MMHVGITGMKDIVKMLDEGEVVAPELQKIHLQMEMETEMIHLMVEDCQEAILEIIEDDPTKGGIVHETQGQDPQEEDVDMMMTVSHLHHHHLDEHQHPDYQI
jgi:hypothetical protein